MGYRSEVAIKFYSEFSDDAGDMASFKNAYDKAYGALSEEDQGIVDLLMNADEKNGWHDGVFTFHADYVKWYDGYSWVKFFIELLEQVEDLGINSEFIRIGEDYGDIETERQGDGGEYYLNVVRTIDGV